MADQEENKQPKQGGVMDIATPSNKPVPQAPAIDPSTGDVKPATAPPATDTAKKPGLSAELIAQAQAETGKPAQAQAVDSKHPPKLPGQKGAPKLAIALAILIAIALAGLTVYVYLETQGDKTDGNNEQTTSENTTAPSQPASQADIDETTKEVDEAIKSAEEAELTESQLSDQSLGL